MTDTPIFRQLCDERLLDMTEPDSPARPPTFDGPALAGVDAFDPVADAATLARIDGFCEDRPQHELTDHDGTE